MRKVCPSARSSNGQSYLISYCSGQTKLEHPSNAFKIEVLNFSFCRQLVHQKSHRGLYHGFMVSSARVLLATCLLVLFGFALAQQVQPAAQSKKDPIQIVGMRDAQLRFQLGRSSRILDLRNDLNGCWSAIFDATDSKTPPEAVLLVPRVLDEIQKSGFWYLVLQINLNSGCNVQGYCGAGSVTQVFWFKFDRQLKAVARDSVMVSDCATNIEPIKFDGKGGFDDIETQLEMRGGKLEVSFQKADFSKKINTVSSLVYDRRVPEKGMLVSSKTFTL
jgi:hypothetical protein